MLNRKFLIINQELFLQLIDISDDGFVTLMNDKGDTRDDLRLPEGDLGQKVRDEFTKEDNTVIVSVNPFVLAAIAKLRNLPVPKR